MARYTLPSKKSPWPKLMGVAAALLVGAVAGFVTGRAFPDRQVIEQRVQVALHSTPGGSAQPRTGRAGLGGEGRTSASLKMAFGADLRVSLREVFALTDPIRRVEAIRAIVGALPRDRWVEFFEALEKMGEDQEFEDNPNSMLVALGTFETVISEIAAQAPERFLTDMFAKDPKKVSDDAFEGVFRSWAARDITAAVAFFDRTIRPLKPDEQGDLAGHLAREFVKKNADSTFVWIKGLPTEKQGEVAREAFQTLSHVDSAKAAEILVAHTEIPDRSEVASAIAEGWARTEPAKAFDWAAALPADLSPNALGTAAASWAGQNYAKALERVTQLDPATRAACLPGLASGAPEAEIPGFAARLHVEPESDHRSSAATALLARWAQKDPATASQWLAEEPPGPTRDGAIRGFAGQLLESDPASAFEWAAVMADRNGRASFLDDGIKKWAEKDPAAARQWVLGSERLSADDREKLLVRTGR